MSNVNVCEVNVVCGNLEAFKEKLFMLSDLRCGVLARPEVSQQLFQAFVVCVYDVHMRTHTHTYTYIHTHAHTHIHTHT